MRKICFLAFFVLIILLSFNISFAGYYPEPGFAQDLTLTPVPQSDYNLPYPGLLPDSPLYIFRVIRDKVVSFLISDPKRKAEFDLLQADKRLNAGVFMLDSANQNDKKMKLAVSTMSKAENYFGSAIESAKEAKRKGMDVMGIAGKLIDSSRKHQEILRLYKEKSGQNIKDSFVSLEKRAVGFESEAKSLISKR